jgi:hypothetical protein
MFVVPARDGVHARRPKQKGVPRPTLGTPFSMKYW